jgi:carbon-monoxide dehydrogenase iron sulfur subunit
MRVGDYMCRRDPGGAYPIAGVAFPEERGNREEILMSRKVLFTRPSLCVNCRICEMACSFSRTGTFNPVRARIWIHRNEKGVDLPIACRHCVSPPCEKACPVGAISRDNESGIVRISGDNCIGCYECVKICPFGAIRIDDEADRAFKCDLCDGSPECVKWCPTGAIKYVERRTLATLDAIDKIR